MQTEQMAPVGDAERDLADELSGKSLDNSERVSETGEVAKKAVDELVALLVQIERAIVLVDRELRISQPPRQGKLGVRWWRNGGREMRMPVLIAWWRAQGRNGRWRARRVAQVRRDRIPTDGSSGLCAENTYKLALLATRLIREYEGLTADLRAIQRQLERRAQRFALVRSLEDHVVAEHLDIIKKLDGAGYDVDARVRALPDTFLE